jgi:hypothetical protein
MLTIYHLLYTLHTQDLPNLRGHVADSTDDHRQGDVHRWQLGALSCNAAQRGGAIHFLGLLWTEWCGQNGVDRMAAGRPGIN